MNRSTSLIISIAFVLIAAAAVAQQPSTPPPSTGSSSNVTTLRGCLDGQRGNYIVVEDKTGLVYALKGVGYKLDGQVHHEVEVKGRVRPGIIKTGVNPAKAGSNPSDTEHGVDGVPLEVADVHTDIRTISKHCKAADQQ